MAEPFTLDTSGEVRGARLIEQPDGNWRSHWTWSDLTPFTQGTLRQALEGLRAHLADQAELAGLHGDQRPIGDIRGFVEAKFDAKTFTLQAEKVAYRHLAPETLARIMEDCERAEAMSDFGQDDPAEAGREFYMRRQGGEVDGFPPLTLYLDDDGLIRIRTASAS